MHTIKYYPSTLTESISIQCNGYERRKILQFKWFILMEWILSKVYFIQLITIHFTHELPFLLFLLIVKPSRPIVRLFNSFHSNPLLSILHYQHSVTTNQHYQPNIMFYAKQITLTNCTCISNDYASLHGSITCLKWYDNPDPVFSYYLLHWVGLHLNPINDWE